MMKPKTTERTSPGGLRFSRLRLENWRNFSRIEMELQRRVFLVGPNASGKSNLLDVFRFLADLASVGGGLQAAVQKKPRVNLSALRSLAARNPSDVVIVVSTGDETTPDLWEYELRLGQDKKQRPKVGRERVTHKGEPILERPDAEDEKDPERLLQTSIEQLSVNVQFRELAVFFSSVRYLHLVPQLVREPDRSVGRRNDPFGGDFLDQVAMTNKKKREARLSRITRALRVAVPQLQQLELSFEKIGTPHLRGKYEHWRPQGAWQTEDQLSDGTLRLLGLLWAMLDGEGPLLLEEPELSLHPEVVRYLPQMFARIQKQGGRQVLVSTHSTDLLRDEGIGLDEIFLLQPQGEGTTVQSAREFEEVEMLLRNGSTLAEAVVPLTRPRDASQLVCLP
jgi:predicted ATPase